MCQKNHWISAAELPKALKISQEDLPEKILLIGFDDFPPSTAKFFDKIKSHCCIETIIPSTQQASIERFELADTETEIRQMAKWALAKYQENTELTIACIIPNLTVLRENIVRIFFRNLSR